MVPQNQTPVYGCAGVREKNDQAGKRVDRVNKISENRTQDRAKASPLPSADEQWPDILDHIAQLTDAGVLPDDEEYAT
jgi:hypothetical protein